MVLRSIQALGNTLLRTQLETDTPSIVNSFSNYSLVPLQKIIGKKTFKVSNKNLSSIPSPTSFFSDTFKITFKVALSTGAFLIIQRTRFYPLTKKFLVGITVVTILGVVARVISLFQTRVTTVFNENASVFSAIQEINSGESSKTGEQKTFFSRLFHLSLMNLKISLSLGYNNKKSKKPILIHSTPLPLCRTN